jgi:hypothetical protein
VERKEVMRLLPRYPVYVPSRGRFNSLTCRFLQRDKVPFYLVVQPQDYDEYAKSFGKECILVLPFTDLERGLVRARNWIKAHATAAGYARHWQLDDNIRELHRYHLGKRIACDAGVALRVVEDFSDRYENIAISGLNYSMFVTGHDKHPPFYVNVHVYSCTLVLNGTPYQWRGRYNDDTDLCLQVLSGGWCTVLVNAFTAQKMATMKVRGGNTEIYQGSGRLQMARELERRWPRVVFTQRRFGRPQHVIVNQWRHFTTELKLRKKVDLKALKRIDEYGLSLQALSDVQSTELKAYVKRVKR